MSPFRSQAQRAYLHANNPDLAKQWEAETPKGADLPEHVESPKKLPHPKPVRAVKRPKVRKR